MRSSAVALLAFLLSALAAFHVDLIGVLGYNEILLVAIFPFLIPAIVRSRTVKRHRVIILIGCLYLVSQIFADLYRHSASTDYLRGWAKIGLTIAMFCVSSALFVRNLPAILAFIIGAHVVEPIRLLLEGPIYGEEQVYKLQLGATVSMLVFLILGFRPKLLKMPSGVLAVGAGILAFLRGARSLAGVTLMALVAYWVGRFRLLRAHGLSKKKLLIPVAIFLAASWSILEAYRWAAPKGLLGEEATAKYEYQAYLLNAGSFSLLSGRLELLFAGPKIIRSPLLGYGSWAKDVDYVYNRAIDLGLEPDSIVNITPAEPGLIPAHSHIFGAWLEAGLAGAIFWGIALYMSVDILIRQKFTRYPTLAAVGTYLIMSFVWDLIFSPYGADRRIWNGFLFAWIAAIYYKSRQNDDAGSESSSRKSKTRREHGGDVAATVSG